MASAMNSGSSCLGFNPSQGHCVVLCLFIYLFIYGFVQAVPVEKQ